MSLKFIPPYKHGDRVLLANSGVEGTVLEHATNSYGQSIYRIQWRGKETWFVGIDLTPAKENTDETRSDLRSR